MLTEPFIYKSIGSEFPGIKMDTHLIRFFNGIGFVGKKVTVGDAPDQELSTICLEDSREVAGAGSDRIIRQVAPCLRQPLRGYLEKPSKFVPIEYYGNNNIIPGKRNRALFTVRLTTSAPDSTNRSTLPSASIRGSSADAPRYEIVDPATREPLFEAEVKKNYSKAQSVSYANPSANYQPNVYIGAGRQGCRIGIRIDPKEALLQRIYTMDAYTTFRPYDFETLAEAQSYLRKQLSWRGTMVTSLKALESSDPLLMRKLWRRLPLFNEVLARIRWNTDGTSHICIFEDTPLSRIGAQHAAQICYEHLCKHGLALDISAVPVSFYLPHDDSNPKHLNLYSLEEQKEDIEKIYRDYARQNNQQGKWERRSTLASFPVLGPDIYDLEIFESFSHQETFFKKRLAALEQAIGKNQPSGLSTNSMLRFPQVSSVSASMAPPNPNKVSK